MPGPNVGSAYVIIRADSTRLPSDITRDINRIFNRGGRDAADAFSDGFAERMRSFSDRISSVADRAGRDAGNSFSDSFDSSAGRSLQTFTRRLRDLLADGGDDAGAEAGRGFSLTFNREAEARIRAFSGAMSRVLSSGADDAGSTSGLLYMQRFGDAVRRTGLDFSGPVFADITRQAGEAGDEGGASLAQRFGRRLDTDITPRVNGFLRRLRDQMVRGGGDAGGAGGRAVADGFGQGFNLDLGPINLQFASLTQAFIRLFPAAVAVGNAIVGLVAQAVALSSAVASAASASALFVPILTSLGQGFFGLFAGLQGFQGVLNGTEGALDSLAPTARSAAIEIIALRDAFNQIRANVQNALFANLDVEIRNLTDLLLPALQIGLVESGRVWNAFLQSFLQAAVLPENVSALNRVMESQNDILANLLAAINPLITAFRDWLIPALPWVEQLSQALQGGAERLAEMAAEGRANGDTFLFFQRAYENASNLLAALRDLTVGLVNFFSVGQDEGAGMLESLRNLAATFREWTESAAGQNTIQQFFDFGAVAGERLMTILNILFQLFSPLVTTVSQLLGAISPILPIIEQLATMIGQNLAIALAPVVTLVGTFAAQFAEVLAPLLPVVGFLLATVAQSVVVLVEALMPAIPALIEVATILGEGLAVILPQVATLVADLVTAIAPLVAELIVALAPAVTTVIGWLVQLAQVVIPPLAAIITGVLVVGITILVGAITTVIGWVRGFIGAAGDLIGWLRNLNGPIGAVASLLSGPLSGAVSAVTDFFSGFAGVIEDVANWLRNVDSPAEAARDIIDLLGDAADAAGGPFGALADFIRGAVDVIRDIAGAVRGAIGGIQDLINAIGNIPSLPSFDIPGIDIPGFAAGRMLYGPTKAWVGEAGREAVVPLDRPLSMVDPSVRWIRQLIDGNGSTPMASGGMVGGGRQVTVMPGAVQIVTQVTDPDRAAEAALDRLAVAVSR